MEIKYRTEDVYLWKSFRVGLRTGKLIPLLYDSSGKEFNVIDENYYRELQDEETRNKVFSLYNKSPDIDTWNANERRKYEQFLTQYGSQGYFISIPWEEYTITGVGFYCYRKPAQAYAYMEECRRHKESRPSLDDIAFLKKERYVLAKVKVWGSVVDCEYLTIAENMEFVELYADYDANTRRMLSHKIGWPGKIKSVKEVIKWQLLVRSARFEKSQRRSQADLALRRKLNQNLYRSPIGFQYPSSLPSIIITATQETAGMRNINIHRLGDARKSFKPKASLPREAQTRPF